MPASKKPRKAYRPRPAMANAHARAMNAVTRLTGDEIEQAQAPLEAAMTALCEGAGDMAQHWAVIVDAMNVAEALAAERICSDVASIATIAEAQKALARLHRQHHVLGSWLPWQEDVAAIAAGVELHGLQLTVCDYAEYRRAIDGVIRRMKGARAGNVGKGVQVLGVDPGAPVGDKTVYWGRDEHGQTILSNPQEAGDVR